MYHLGLHNIREKLDIFVEYCDDDDEWLYSPMFLYRLVSAQNMESEDRALD